MRLISRLSIGRKWPTLFTGHCMAVAYSAGDHGTQSQLHA
jgi:hypothetical protein